MAALVSQFDWSATKLGSIDSWSTALLATTRLLLANSFPMLLWWGPDFIQIYNDAYIPVLGEKHPHAALGKPFRECWREVFDVLGPLAQRPFDGGPPTHMDDIPLEVNRFNFVEETHFTIGYSPVPDDTAPRGIGGVLATVHEITGRTLAERRVIALRDLGARLHAGKSAEEACEIAASTLAQHDRDLPFTMTYLLAEDRKSARLVAQTGVGLNENLAPQVVTLDERPTSPWPLSSVNDSAQPIIVSELMSHFEKVPSGPWSDPADSAAILPIRSSFEGHPAGYFIAGISPRLRFDESYRSFVELVAAQIGTAISSARAFEDERKRREALAEIDRAKTVFFTNVSHEFRTPLTLMLGSLEEALAQEPLSASLAEPLSVAHRSSLRLLKLVNTLLDFARIESGRVQAAYAPVELGGLTADLASVFRSAMERAGIDFSVQCDAVRSPVYVDRDMWEKIVHNLISNAFKFTLSGSITVTLRDSGEAAELTVRDTGVGIAAEDLPHIFERFRRVKGSAGRSIEGSGIGLALVQELVRLHGGSIDATSELGKGSTFVIRIPFGRPFEVADGVVQTGSSRLSSSIFVQEIEGWLSGDQPNTLGVPSSDVIEDRPRVVLADDNADMRDYVRRLLSASFKVEAVSDGEAALAALKRQNAHIVLTDVMMPVLDGFGLLRAVRSDPELASTPAILLSARAGGEARMEGLAAGADDYLVKPFAARELLARVENQIHLSAIRKKAEAEIRESEERLRAFVTASSDVVYRMSPDWSVMYDLRGRAFISDTSEPDAAWIEKYIHPDDREAVLQTIHEAIENRNVFQLEHRVIRADGSLGWTFSRAVPIFDAKGEVAEWFGAASDITARKAAERALLRSEKLVSLGRMAASIAHEINNPLEAVTNLLFLARMSPDLPDEVRSQLDLVDGELNRVAHITRQSLGFYRESNAPASVSVVTLMNSTLALLQNKVKVKHARIQTEWFSDAHVMVVPGELRQVFSNLLLNSLDAIGDGGTIRLRVSEYQAPRKRKLRITFADNGSGITSESKARLFEPMFTTKGTVGTGLGLWVSRQLIERAAGSIQFRSRRRAAGSGAVFSITIPIA